MRRLPAAILGLLSATVGTVAACSGGGSLPPVSASTTGTTGTTMGAGGTAEGGGGSGPPAATSSTGGGGAGGMADAGPDVDIGTPSPDYPAPHPNPPTVEDEGGPVLAMPEIYPVFFAGDDPAITAEIEAFVSHVGATPYWAATTGEYGVGPATGETPIALTETAGTSLTQASVAAWLAQKLDSDDPAFPVPGPNTMFALFYPAGATITTSSGTTCQQIGGYHTSVALDADHGSRNVAYAVIPRCPSFDGFTGIDAVTAGGSHELIEASTDPYPNVDTAYGTVDQEDSYWVPVLGGGEVGDMCAWTTQSFTKFPGFDYVVQRTWSNESALAGHDPCVPIPVAGVYFNSVPVLPDVVMMGGASLRGVTIAVGASRTIDVDLYSDGNTGAPWSVHAVDESAARGDPAKLTFDFDATSGSNGQTLHLTITAQSRVTPGEPFYLVSQLGNQQSVWVGFVMN